MSINEFPQTGKNKLENDEKQIPENENAAFKNSFLELNDEDAKLFSEEFMILNRSVIPQLKSKISSFRLIDQASEEMKSLSKSDRIPSHMKDSFGTQEDLDKLIDTLSEKLQDLEKLKTLLLNKDIESIKSYREGRIKEMEKKFGAYSLTGEEYHRKEDRYNRELDKENELRRIMDEINRLPNLN